MVYFLCKAYDSDRQNCYFAQSLPVRGAWIEMQTVLAGCKRIDGRSPCGERGLKSRASLFFFVGMAVAPRAGSVD